MRPPLALALVFAFLAAGCVREAANPYEPIVQDDSGVARIIVQDNTGQRVVNATVLVRPSGAYGTTDAQGIFMALGLPPGNATVIVNADGFSDGKRDFVVEVGKVREVVVFVGRMR